MPAQRLNLRCVSIGIVASVLLTATGTSAQNPANPPISAISSTPAKLGGWSYADVADVFAEAPVIASVRVTDAIVVPEPGDSPALPATKRYYLVGDVQSLIRGPAGGVAPRVAWLADLAVDARGRVTRMKKQQVLLAALPVEGRPGELRLAAADAMMPLTPTIDALVRSIAKSALDSGTTPRVTGISGAFHVPGNLPGESETQVFLTTVTRQPVSLSILRRPGLASQLSVALGEIIDAAAGVPPRDTLGWYRIACFLPAGLPQSVVERIEGSDVEVARADYRFAVEQLGRCERVRR